MTTKKELLKIRRNIDKVYEKQKHLKIELAHPIPKRWYGWKMDELLGKIISHWCLVRYRTLTGVGLYKLAWKIELRKLIESAMAMTVEEDDSKASRRRIISHEVYGTEYCREDVVEAVTSLKFYQEELDMTIPEYRQTVEDCASNINDIVELILRRDIDEAMEYVDSL